MPPTTIDTFGQHVAAKYTTREKVKQAQQTLNRHLGLKHQKIKVIPPSGIEIGEESQVKNQLSGENMLLMHIQWAAFGLSLGMLLAFLLVEFGPQMFANSPVFTYIALITPSMFIGFILAGMRTLTLEQDLPEPVLAEAVPNTETDDFWTLIVDTSNTDLSKNEVAAEIKRTPYIEIYK